MFSDAGELQTAHALFEALRRFTTVERQDGMLGDLPGRGVVRVKFFHLCWRYVYTFRGV